MPQSPEDSPISCDPDSQKNQCSRKSTTTHKKWNCCSCEIVSPCTDRPRPKEVVTQPISKKTSAKIFDDDWLCYSGNVVAAGCKQAAYELFSPWDDQPYVHNIPMFPNERVCSSMIVTSNNDSVDCSSDFTETRKDCVLSQDSTDSKLSTGVKCISASDNIDESNQYSGLDIASNVSMTSEIGSFKNFEMSYRPAKNISRFSGSANYIDKIKYGKGGRNLSNQDFFVNHTDKLYERELSSNEHVSNLHGKMNLIKKEEFIQLEINNQIQSLTLSDEPVKMHHSVTTIPSEGKPRLYKKNRQYPLKPIIPVKCPPDRSNENDTISSTNSLYDIIVHRNDEKESVSSPVTPSVNVEDYDFPIEMGNFGSIKTLPRLSLQHEKNPLHRYSDGDAVYRTSVTAVNDLPYIDSVSSDSDAVFVENEVTLRDSNSSIPNDHSDHSGLGDYPSISSNLQNSQFSGKIWSQSEKCLHVPDEKLTLSCKSSSHLVHKSIEDCLELFDRGNKRDSTYQDNSNSDESECTQCYSDHPFSEITGEGVCLNTLPEDGIPENNVFNYENDTFSKIMPYDKELPAVNSRGMLLTDEDVDDFELESSESSCGPDDFKTTKSPNADNCELPCSNTVAENSDLPNREQMNCFPF